MVSRNLTNSGVKYGALAGFVGAELGIVGMAAVYSLGGVFGYGPSTPGMAIPIFLIGQVLGALPATLLGGVLGGVGGLLFAHWPDTVAKGGGMLWGVLYALSVYLLLVLCVHLGVGRTFVEYEVFALLFDYLTSPTTPDPEFLLLSLAVFILYLGAGAWGGAKLAKRVQGHTETNP